MISWLRKNVRRLNLRVNLRLVENKSLNVDGCVAKKGVLRFCSRGCEHCKPESDSSANSRLAAPLRTEGKPENIRVHPFATGSVSAARPLR